MKFYRVDLGRYMDNFKNLILPILAKEFDYDYPVSDLWQLIVEDVADEAQKEFGLCDYHSYDLGVKMVAMGYISTEEYPKDKRVPSTVFEEYREGVKMVDFNMKAIDYLLRTLTCKEFYEMQERLK